MGHQAFWKKTDTDTSEKQAGEELWEQERNIRDNKMEVSILAIPENEQLARMLVTAFVMPLNPTIEELSDIKTAVSEAVTNAIIHGYPKELFFGEEKYVHITCRNEEHTLHVKIQDEGVGIEDVKKAMEPMYTTKPELERSGMGFAFMEAFMDGILVKSKLQKGVTVIMNKTIGKEVCHE
ncbi:MAG: anti-sigma F factor [Lachnospira sp.]|nr:anti-sigma F factor [Lachnospira sp.]